LPRHRAEYRRLSATAAYLPSSRLFPVGRTYQNADTVRRAVGRRSSPIHEERVNLYRHVEEEGEADRFFLFADPEFE
jgi:hypothetical protein